MKEISFSMNLQNESDLFIELLRKIYISSSHFLTGRVRRRAMSESSGTRGQRCEVTCQRRSGAQSVGGEHETRANEFYHVERDLKTSSHEKRRSRKRSTIVKRRTDAMQLSDGGEKRNWTKKSYETNVNDEPYHWSSWVRSAQSQRVECIWGQSRIVDTDERQRS